MILLPFIDILTIGFTCFAIGIGLANAIWTYTMKGDKND